MTEPLLWLLPLALLASVLLWRFVGGPRRFAALWRSMDDTPPKNQSNAAPSLEGAGPSTATETRALRSHHSVEGEAVLRFYASIASRALTHMATEADFFLDNMREKTEAVEQLLCATVLAWKAEQRHRLDEEKAELQKAKRNCLNNSPQYQRVREAQEGLMWLISHEDTPDPSAVQFCVRNGADVSAPVDLSQLPVFHHFVLTGHVECFKACLLTTAPLDFTQSDDNGCTVLHEAVRSQPLHTAESIWRALVDRLQTHPEEDKVDWEQQDNGGRDVFTWAAHCQRLSVIWPLVCDLEFFKNRTEPIPLYLTVTKDDWEKLGEENQKRFWTQSVSNPL